MSRKTTGSPEESRRRVTLLAGGVGGAKMAEGLAALAGIELSVIGNVGDDEEFHGLWVSPDIDTLTYSLAGLIDRQQGWGLADEGHRALHMLARFGEDAWMSLGDRDLGLHIWRSMRRRRGERPSDIARDAAHALGVRSASGHGPHILLPTDERLQTRLRCATGWLSFQQYFVREKCTPEILELRFEGAETARPTPEALQAIHEAQIIVIAPSNPLVSIAPILAVPGLRAALQASSAPRIAISPLIAGEAVKGPASRMMRALGMRADVLGLAQHYLGLADLMVIDQIDRGFCAEMRRLGMKAACRSILMRDHVDKARLAHEVIEIAQQMIRQEHPA
jgi:LPPG:FO 2-phospho-L-lactate transferase